MSEFTFNELKWLELILNERFGHDFSIIQENNHLKLFLNSQPEHYILFPTLIKGFHLSKSDLPCGNWNANKEGWNSILHKTIPAPGVSNLKQPLIEQDDNSCFIIHYDILGLTYWILNRIEEIGSKDLDNHQRFPATSSHAYRHGYLERPIVDEWLDVLSQVIKRQWPCINIKKHDFSIKVSHDVDVPSRYGFSSPKDLFKGMAVDIIKKRDFKSAIKAPIIRITNKNKLSQLDPFNTFDWLMDVSEKNNIKSSFYFICGQTDLFKDANYNLDHQAIRKLMTEIHYRGHEIGLHPSYNSFQSPLIIKREADNLKRVMQEEGIKQDIIGGRMHYLRWEHPNTLQAWNDAGLNYDSTLGFADRPGFRCGTCFEYPGFNPISQQILNVRIRPLIVMDCTVISGKYLGLGFSNSAKTKILTLKKVCEKMNGNFTLLWHNSFFQDPISFKLYSELLN